jgi:hypothetical protein
VDADSSPPPPGVPAAGRTLQTVSAAGYDCTGATDVLAAVAASVRVAFDGAAHVDVHIDVHAVVYALQRRVTILTGRQLWL